LGKGNRGLEDSKKAGYLQILLSWMGKKKRDPGPWETGGARGGARTRRESIQGESEKKRLYFDNEKSRLRRLHT